MNIVKVRENRLEGSEQGEKDSANKFWRQDIAEKMKFKRLSALLYLSKAASGEDGLIRDTSTLAGRWFQLIFASCWYRMGMISQ